MLYLCGRVHDLMIISVFHSWLKDASVHDPGYVDKSLMEYWKVTILVNNPRCRVKWFDKNKGSYHLRVLSSVWSGNLGLHYRRALWYGTPKTFQQVGISY